MCLFSRPDRDMTEICGKAGRWGESSQAFASNSWPEGGAGVGAWPAHT